jgi:hypothetical protein
VEDEANLDRAIGPKFWHNYEIFIDFFKFVLNEKFSLKWKKLCCPSQLGMVDFQHRSSAWFTLSSTHHDLCFHSWTKL